MSDPTLFNISRKVFSVLVYLLYRVMGPSQSRTSSLSLNTELMFHCTRLTVPGQQLWMKEEEEEELEGEKSSFGMAPKKKGAR